MDGKYIYGIISQCAEDTPYVPLMAGLRVVYTIAQGGLGCVVSDYSGPELCSLSKEEVIQRLLAHQVVVEHTMREHTVLPVKFGTLLSTREEVHAVLAQGHAQFGEAMAWLQDKVEVEVAATWNTAQVLREIGQEGEIAQARQALASRPGAPTLEERLGLGKMVKASLDQRRASYREKMLGCLRPWAVDVQPNALVSDELVMNVAFLVEKAQQERFDNGVGRLNGLFQDQVHFRIIGPLPPYSFATVEVARQSQENMAEARQLLQLGQVFTEPEVRKAYRHLAAQIHPDCQPGDRLAAARFVQLRLASELLLAHIRGQAGAGDGFLISLRRQRHEEFPQLRFSEGERVAVAAHG